MGVIVLSDAETSEPLALIDARSVTALRTGAVAAVAAQALARPQARERRTGRLRPARRMGGALPCRRRLRRPASASTRAPRRPRRWRPSSAPAGAPGRASEALACDVVTCVTPGLERRRRPRRTCVPARTSTCWAPTGRARPRRRSTPSPRCAALLRRVGAGLARRRADRRGRGGPRARADVTDLGAVLAGEEPGARTTRRRCSTRRAGDPGPRDRRRGARGAARRADRRAARS